MLLCLTGVVLPELGGVLSAREASLVARDGMGLPFREGGREPLSRTLTKLQGNFPMLLGSRLRRPVHHEPSPALRHSM